MPEENLDHDAVNVFVCSRFNHNDMHFFEHFMEHYLSLGVTNFLMNFNCKIYDEIDNLNQFIQYIQTSEYSKYIKFSVGPNIEAPNETENLQMLYMLVERYATQPNSFVIPADADEFVCFPQNLNEIIQGMIENGYSHIQGETKERIASDGSCPPLMPKIDIFSQFPKINPNLFVKPKVGLIKANYFKYTGVGHHQIRIPDDINEQEVIKPMLSQSPIHSETNHFRWNLQGKKRMECWLKIWGNPAYLGWKDLAHYKKMIEIYEGNLSTFNGQ
jgi:hypothetical protein